MIETNDNTARVVPREEKPLRVFQMVTGSNCANCAWKSSCIERKDTYRAALGNSAAVCTAIRRDDKTPKILKEI